MKDWVTPFKETAANVKATASLLETFLFKGLQDRNAPRTIVCYFPNLGFIFFSAKSFSLIFIKGKNNTETFYVR